MGPHAHLCAAKPHPASRDQAFLGTARRKAGLMGPHAHIRSLPPEGAECRGSMPACAGMDGTRRRRV